MSETAPAGSPDAGIVAQRVAGIRQRIMSAGGDPGTVRVVAVTKTFGPDAVRAAIGAGIADVGENYASELLATAAAVGEDATPAPCWHFIGSIQRRDVRKLASVVAVFEGVDRLVEGEAIARIRPGATVYVEIDATGLPGRSGVPLADADELIVRLRKLELDVAGVMTIAPPDGGEPASRAFAAVAAVADAHGLRERSMGMSGDLELAVSAGSTAVRIGRALFGVRAGRPRGATMGDQEGRWHRS